MQEITQKIVNIVIDLWFGHFCGVHWIFYWYKKSDI